jgi:hypothetical protein
MVPRSSLVVLSICVSLTVLSPVLTLANVGRDDHNPREE